MIWTLRVAVVMLFGMSGHAMASAQTARALHVAAAADLRPVLPKIAANFERQNHLRVEITYGASGTLTAQIENGAPFDVFLAADMSFPKQIISAGLASASQPTLYARGVLVLWARKDSVLQPLTLDSLHDGKLRRLAIANPQTAPYGRAAMAALKTSGLVAEVTPKLVTAENIAQAAQFAESGSADAGMISMNSADNPPLAKEGTYIVIPARSYPPIEQGAVVLRRAADAGQAQAFVDAVAKALLHANDIGAQPDALPVPR